VLTLTRKSGERIAIGTSIEVTVVEVSGGRVRIGIKAPRELAVHRGEVVDRIEQENRRAMAERDARTGRDAAIAFPEGLYGMATHRAFVLCELGNACAARALVSESDSTVQLLVVDASEVWPGYEELAAVGKAKADAGLDDEEVALAAVVTAPADGTAATVNLLAPILVGLRSRRGCQVILEGSDFGVRHALESASAGVAR
jgi:carbon storage regulator